MSFDKKASTFDQNQLQETNNISAEGSPLIADVVQSPGEDRKDCCDEGPTENAEQNPRSSSLNESTADELLANGKAALRQGNVELAVEKFSESVEKKLKELGLPDGELHSLLGPFYLEYGNALLKNAENSNQLFQLETAETAEKTDQPLKLETAKADRKENQPLKLETAKADKKENQPLELETTETAEKTNEQNGSPYTDRSDNDISDEQLAWEILELARICYASKLDELEREFPISGNEAFRRVVEDAAFVHLRLGDLLTAEEKFEEAAEEFAKSLNLLTKYQLPYTYHLSTHIALGQAQLFCGQVKESLITFKTALRLVTDQLNGVDGASVPADRLGDFRATQEDITIQISEIERLLSQGETAPSSSSSSSSSSSGGGLSALSTGPWSLEKAGVATSDYGEPSNSFAPSQLKSEYGETVLGVIEGKRAKARAKAAGELKEGTDVAIFDNSVAGTSQR